MTATLNDEGDPLPTKLNLSVPVRWVRTDELFAGNILIEEAVTGPGRFRTVLDTAKNGRRVTVYLNDGGQFIRTDHFRQPVLDVTTAAR